MMIKKKLIELGKRYKKVTKSNKNKPILLGKLGLKGLNGIIY